MKMGNICHLLNFRSYSSRWKTQSPRRKTFYSFFERCPTEPACPLFLKRRCVYLCFCVSECVCVVRLPVHFACLERLNRFGSHTTASSYQPTHWCQPTFCSFIVATHIALVMVTVHWVPHAQLVTAGRGLPAFLLEIDDFAWSFK